MTDREPEIYTADELRTFFNACVPRRPAEQEQVYKRKHRLIFATKNGNPLTTERVNQRCRTWALQRVHAAHRAKTQVDQKVLLKWGDQGIRGGGIALDSSLLRIHLQIRDKQG